MAAVVARYPQPLGVLRPSQAPRWFYCQGSFALEGLYPEDEDSPEAREGTAAHYYVTEYLEGRVHPIGTLAPNGHPLDGDMVKNGRHYIEDVMTGLAELGGSRVLFRVETKVTAHGLVHPECEGTPDTFALSLEAKRLIVWDYKYGHGFVDPFQNWQLIAYVAGIWESLELTLEDVADMAVSLRVVQPRNYHREGKVRTWETTGAVLWGLIEQLSAAAYAAKQIGAPTQTGDHCDNCSGRHACEAFKRVAAKAMDVAGQTIPDPLPTDALGVEIARLRKAADRIKARLDGLEEQAISSIRKGNPVPGWAMGFVNSRERWKTDPAEVFALGDLLGVDLRDLRPVTVNEAKTKFKAAGVDAAVIAAYSEKPTGAAKLVPADPTAAAKAFGG